MRDSLPVELSPFLRCVILLCERDGKISVTRNSALAGRRSGWKPASRVESELIRGEKIRRFLDFARDAKYADHYYNRPGAGAAERKMARACSHDGRFTQGAWGNGPSRA